MKIIFWLSLGLILYTYVFYIIILKLLSLLFNRKENVHIIENFVDNKVSVIISAFNEEKIIKKRISNLLSQNYPKDQMEIIIASDGSSDNTVSFAKSFKERIIKILDFPENRGRALLQNDAVKAARGEIIILTDAETEFESEFVRNIVRYFAHPDIGCVVGNLIYKSDSGWFGRDEVMYFAFEKSIRELEAKLGILAKTTGACMAVRKSLWRDLLETDDADFITPLDVLLQGYKVGYAKDAVAYDVPALSLRSKIKARIRHSCKCFYGVSRKWKWKEYIRHPIISWGLISHRFLRYFTPFFLITVFLCNLLLLFDLGQPYILLMIFQLIFYGLGLIGFISYFLNIRLPVVSTITNFVIANAAILIGVILALTGNVKSSYKPIRS